MGLEVSSGNGNISYWWKYSWTLCHAVFMEGNSIYIMIMNWQVNYSFLLCISHIFPCVLCRASGTCVFNLILYTYSTGPLSYHRDSSFSLIAISLGARKTISFLHLIQQNVTFISTQPCRSVLLIKEQLILTLHILRNWPMTARIFAFLFTFSYNIHLFICRFYSLLCTSIIQLSIRVIMMYLNSAVRKWGN